MNQHQILSMDEIKIVLKAIKDRIEHHGMRGHVREERNWRLSLVIFRLSACCGLRAKEISGLNLADVSIYGDKPVVAVRKAITKGRVRDVIKAGRLRVVDTRRSRFVPLWWSESSLRDLAFWKAIRETEGAGPKDPFLVTSLSRIRMVPSRLWNRWKIAVIAGLGEGRGAQVRLHDGRHSFASHALQSGRSLVAVRDALGHANVSTTSAYLHSIDRPDLGDVFA